MGKSPTLMFQGSDLYIGGQFTSAGGVSALNVAKWNGSSWSVLGSGLKGPPGGSFTTIPVSGWRFWATTFTPAVYFTNAAASTAKRAWRSGMASAWSSIGGVNDLAVRAASNSGSIYFCGRFNLASNSRHWLITSSLGRFGVARRHRQARERHAFFVQALAMGQDGLYMGGSFVAAGNTPASHIAGSMAQTGRRSARV